MGEVVRNLGRAPAAEGRRLVFVSGIFGSRYKLDNAGITGSFGDVYGADNVTVFNSPISIDNPDPHRPERMQAAVTPLEGTSGVTFVSHSLGCAEITAIQPRDGHQDQVRSVLFSPSSLGGVWERIKFLRRLMSDQYGLGRGRNSLVAFPLKDIPQEAIRALFPKESHVGKGYEIVDMTQLSQLNDHRDKLNDKQLTRLNRTDADLVEALRDGRQKKAKRFIRRRGGRRVTGKALGQFDAASPAGGIGFSFPRDRYSLRMLFQGLNRRPLEKMEELDNAGSSVEILVGEYDIVRPESFEGRKVRVIPGMTHISILFQPKLFAEIVARGDRPQDAIITP